MTRSSLHTAALGLFTALALAGCTSPEQRACENKKQIELEKLKSYGVDVGDKSNAEVIAGCVDTLARLRADTKASDAVWSAYLGCLTSATTNGQLEECLGPLTQDAAKHMLEEQLKQLAPPADGDPADAASDPAAEDAAPAPSRPKKKLY
ncbi:MAG: hypothetical protein H6713_17645 [Myxococcales bacterium]|nr:hypothetical protein [Myxococcales bacterium]